MYINITLYCSLVSDTYTHHYIREHSISLSNQVLLHNALSLIVVDHVQKRLYVL